MVAGSEVKKINSMGGVLVVVDLLRRSMTWGIVDAFFLGKEMTVSDGCDGRSWDFHGGLLMPSSSCAELQRLRLCLLLVLSDGGAIVEETSVVFWVYWAVGLQMGVWIGTGEDAVLSLSMRLTVTGLMLALDDGMFFLLIHDVVVDGWMLGTVEGVEDVR